jgi:hypothetical protein
MHLCATIRPLPPGRGLACPGLCDRHGLLKHHSAYALRPSRPPRGPATSGDGVPLSPQQSSAQAPPRTGSASAPWANPPCPASARVPSPHNERTSGELHQAERVLCGVGTPGYDAALRRAFGAAEAVLVVKPPTGPWSGPTPSAWRS